MQMLQTKYTLDLGQILKITFDLKWCMWQKMKPIKKIVMTKPILDKTNIVINGTTMETSLAAMGNK